MTEFRFEEINNRTPLGVGCINEYTYQDPTKKGYVQFKLKKRQHNQLFPNRKIKWYNKYEYYYNEHYILLHCFTSRKRIALNTLLFPFVLLFNGFLNWDKIIKDYRKMYNEKKYGGFVSHRVSNVKSKYYEIIKHMN